MIKIALSFLFLANTLWAADFEPPAYSRPVMDEAHLMTEAVAQQMSVGLESIWKNGGSQIGVLTVESLNGIPIEMASIKTAEKWKLGDAKKDNGVILLISKGDRALRIEVGQGLEGALTDLHSKRIIEDVIVPRFKSGEFEQGVIEGVVTILKYTDPEKNLAVSAGSDFPTGGRRYLRDRSGLLWLIPFFFQHPLLLLFLIFFILRLFGGHRRRGVWYSGGGGWGGGGFGGGGFGGGGFSGGGGGGFSGGGSSGRW